MNHFLIKRPIVTEKSRNLGSLRQYVFEVEPKASSAEIKKLLKKIYKVDAVKVNVINVKPRFGKYGRIKTVRKWGMKKAVVTLKEGQEIDIMPK